jgi:hypothetical protein
MVTILVGSLVTIGYVVIMFTMAVTEIPTAINQVNDEFRIARRKKKYVEQRSFWEIWGSFSLATIATFGFSILHWINFDLNYDLYLALFIAIVIPTFMTTARSVVINYPKSDVCRKFAILYDCIFVKSFFRNNFVLCVFCFLVCVMCTTC